MTSTNGRHRNFRVGRPRALLVFIQLLACLGFFPYASERVSSAQRPLPNPVLVLIGQEIFETGGKSFTRYRFAVDNYNVYPNELFAPSPSLPPCGTNNNASRSWVDVFDSTGKRLYGFCALKDHDGLNQLWFAGEADVVPPSWIYIEINDRQTGTKYKSNLAETTL
ncbi:MAG: hypothetical protein ACREBG_08500 [Pyrinomonadaceae bacterium]